MAEFTEIEFSISHILELFYFMILLASDTIKWATWDSYGRLRMFEEMKYLFLFRSLFVARNVLHFISSIINGTQVMLNITRL